MNNLEQAKMTRNSATTAFLATNATVFTTNVPLNTLTTKFGTDNGICILAASAAGADNTGFSQDKLNAKTAMAQLAAQLCGYAQVKFEILNKHSLAEQLHEGETFYSTPADAEAGARALAVLQVMSDNIADLTDYVTPLNLTDLSNLIALFMNAEGSSGSVHAASPALTQAFKSALKVTDVDIKNILKLGKFYQLSNPTFYNSLVEVCKIPTVNIHHTNVDVTVLDNSNSLPVGNATASLSNSTKTGTSDAAGFLHIDHVHSGNVTLSITCVGYQPFQMLINIENGRDNSYTVRLDAI